MRPHTGYMQTGSSKRQRLSRYIGTDIDLKEVGFVLGTEQCKYAAWQPIVAFGRQWINDEAEPNLFCAASSLVGGQYAHPVQQATCRTSIPGGWAMQRARAGRLLHLPGCWLSLWLLVAATELSHGGRWAGRMLVGWWAVAGTGTGGW